MKKKILFYGNCVLSTIGKWLHENYSDIFEVLDAEDCEIHPFNNTTKNFAVWIDNVEKQSGYYQRVHEKIKQADYFVFQNIEHAAIDKLRPDYLIENVLRGNSIAVQNLRFFAFPTDKIAAIPFIKYVYNNISKDEQEIIRYLTQENDPKFKEIAFEEYKKCMEENKRRFKLYPSNSTNGIDLLDFIEKNWKNYQLFGTHNHLCGLIWRELIAKLFNILEEDLNFKKVDTLHYPNKEVILDLKQFRFINETFPNFEIPEEIPKRLILDNSGNCELNELSIIEDTLEKYYE
jgi:hypothetical protein